MSNLGVRGRRPTTLYRFYDGDQVLLYVGIADMAPVRWEEHRGNARWWRSARSVTLEHFESRKQALIAERQAIQSERPLHNQMHRAADVIIRPTPGRRYGYRAIADELREAIASGRFPVGALLPSVDQLRKIYNVSRGTIRLAKLSLTQEGWIISIYGETLVRAQRPLLVGFDVRGVGAFVREDPLGETER